TVVQLETAIINRTVEAMGSVWTTKCAPASLVTMAISANNLRAGIWLIAIKMGAVSDQTNVSVSMAGQVLIANQYCVWAWPTAVPMANAYRSMNVSAKLGGLGLIAVLEVQKMALGAQVVAGTALQLYQAVAQLEEGVQ